MMENSIIETPYFFNTSFKNVSQTDDNSISLVLMSRTDTPFSIICCAMIELSAEIILPLKYAFICSVVKDVIFPIKDSKKEVASFTFRPYCPFALTGTITLYLGSSICIGCGVPQGKSNFAM